MSALPFALQSMNVLQEQVLNLGICPACHRKKLREAARFDWGVVLQCRTCLTVYSLDPAYQLPPVTTTVTTPATPSSPTNQR